MRGYLPGIAAELTFTDNFVNASTVESPIPDGTGYVPAIAVPTVTKNNFECPHKRLEQLRELLPTTTHLLLIGWRAMDQGFLDLWADALDNAPPPRRVLKRIHIVTGSQRESEEVKLRLDSEVRTRADDTTIGLGGFTHFLSSDEADRFFRAD